MREIEVSTSVFSLIWAMRADGEESENEILARVLPLVHSSNAHHRQIESGTMPSGSKGEGKMRWVDDIVTALKRLGGQASLGEIYRTTKGIRQAAGRSLTPKWQATVRRTLEDHSSDSANYRAENLFRIVDRGIWALR